MKAPCAFTFAFRVTRAVILVAELHTFSARLRARRPLAVLIRRITTVSTRCVCSVCSVAATSGRALLVIALLRIFQIPRARPLRATKHSHASRCAYTFLHRTTRPIGPQQYSAGFSCITSATCQIRRGAGRGKFVSKTHGNERTSKENSHSSLPAVAVSHT